MHILHSSKRIKGRWSALLKPGYDGLDVVWCASQSLKSSSCLQKVWTSFSNYYKRLIVTALYCWTVLFKQSLHRVLLGTRVVAFIFCCCCCVCVSIHLLLPDVAFICEVPKATTISFKKSLHRLFLGARVAVFLYFFVCVFLSIRMLLPIRLIEVSFWHYVQVVYI